MASTTKREFLEGDEPPRESKRAKFAAEAESSEPPIPKLVNVVLNPADCDLDFNIEGNGLQGSALYEQGFAYCWSGARANVGITGGKYFFSCKIISAQPVEMDDTPLDQQHVCRLGISRGDDSVGNLGETRNSFGFGGTGKYSSAGKFENFGQSYGVDDTICCLVDLESKPMASIGFSKNGKWLGLKYFRAGPDGLGVVDSPIREPHWELAVFPHVLLKNVVVQLLFSSEDGLFPENGYKPWASALEDGHAVMGPTFTDPKECEVMMMVGLPASGKTTWAEKWVKEHPEKRYILLGTNLALDQMKVPGLLRKQNYGERFDRLMNHATTIFNTMLSRASKTLRNFIIDQTNVYKSARKRKLKPFAFFQKTAVVVFPTSEDLKSRGDRRFREMGKDVPAEAVNEMIANYVLPMSKDMPRTDEYFDKVIFTELDRAVAQRCLDEMKLNLKLKHAVSPYSRESSVQSYDSTSMPNHRESSIQSYYVPPVQYQHTVSATAGPWEGLYPPKPPLSTPYGNYASTPYGNPPSTRYANAPSTPYGNHSSTPYENHSSSTGDFHPWNDSNQYSSYGGYEQSRRNDTGGGVTASPGVLSDPYGTYVTSDTCNRPDIEGRRFVPMGGSELQSGMVDPYARTSFIHPTYGIGGGPPADIPAPRGTAMLRDSPATYGSYGAARSRPSYNNFPNSLPHSGGYFPPRPGYY